MSITIEQLCRAMPFCSFTRAKQMLGPMNKAMERASIDTRLDRAAFVATIGHETMDLLYMQEIADGSKYEGRLDLGNTMPGDGKRYKGRGPIQITGRDNYTRFAAWSGLDCVRHPELLEDPDNGFLASAWFWMDKGISRFADADDFKHVSILINGRGKDGYPNGWSERLARYTLAKKVLA